MNKRKRSPEQEAVSALVRRGKYEEAMALIDSYVENGTENYRPASEWLMWKRNIREIADQQRAKK